MSRVVERHRAAVATLKDKSELEKAVAKAKRDASAAISALRDSIETLDLAHIHARLEAEATVAVATPERLRLQLVEMALTEERLCLLTQVPEELRDAKWNTDWSRTIERRSNAERKVVQAGLILAKGASLEEAEVPDV